VDRWSLGPFEALIVEVQRALPLVPHPSRVVAIPRQGVGRGIASGMPSPAGLNPANPSYRVSHSTPARSSRVDVDLEWQVSCAPMASSSGSAAVTAEMSHVLGRRDTAPVADVAGRPALPGNAAAPAP
jgi:hypothetical protein